MICRTRRGGIGWSENAVNLPPFKPLLPDVFAPEEKAFISPTIEVCAEFFLQHGVISERSDSTGAEPTANGRAKTLFAPIDYIIWQDWLHSAFEEVFGNLAPEFVMVRETTGKICDFDIKKWAPHLKGVHHAGAVGFRKDAVLEINLRVKLECPVHHIRASTRIPRFDRLAVDFLDAHAGVGKARKVGGLEGT